MDQFALQNLIIFITLVNLRVFSRELVMMSLMRLRQKNSTSFSIDNSNKQMSNNSRKYGFYRLMYLETSRQDLRISSKSNSIRYSSPSMLKKYENSMPIQNSNPNAKLKSQLMRKTRIRGLCFQVSLIAQEIFIYWLFLTILQSYIIRMAIYQNTSEDYLLSLKDWSF